MAMYMHAPVDGDGHAHTAHTLEPHEYGGTN